MRNEWEVVEVEQNGGYVEVTGFGPQELNLDYVEQELNDIGYGFHDAVIYSADTGKFVARYKDS